MIYVHFSTCHSAQSARTDWIENFRLELRDHRGAFLSRIVDLPRRVLFGIGYGRGR